MRSWAPRLRNRCFSPRTPSWHLQKRSESEDRSLLFFHLLFSFSWDRPGRRAEECNAPPSRGQRRGNGQKSALPQSR